jgi:hypothetical protein
VVVTGDASKRKGTFDILELVGGELSIINRRSVYINC